MNTQLSAGQHVKGQQRSVGTVYGTVHTIASSCAKYGQNPADQIARAKEQGAPVAWVSREISMLVGDREEGARMARERADIIANAPELVNGQQVEIDGQRYTVKVTGWSYSDPIHFIPVTA